MLSSSGITATHVGVHVARNPSEFTCNRCGAVKKINNKRTQKNGEYTPLDRRTYQCHDCTLVEALIEREEA